MTEAIAELDADTASALAPLIGIGCQSGDTVMGLSAVRRTARLAFVFVDAGVAAGTVAELARLQRSGTRLLHVTRLDLLTSAAGRDDLSVVGVKSGPLADGINGRIPLTE